MSEKQDRLAYLKAKPVAANAQPGDGENESQDPNIQRELVQDKGIALMQMLNKKEVLDD